MDIFEVDKNFALKEIDVEDIEFVSARDVENCLFGVYYDKITELYRRMPNDIAKSISDGVEYNSKCTAGGRLRFKTDSPYIALKVVEPYEKTLSSMSVAGQFGFGIEADGLYHGDISPFIYDEYTRPNNEYGKGNFSFYGIKFFAPGKKTRQITAYFPLYNSVSELYIGIKKGSVISVADDYKYRKQILFYGPSTTQGAAASRPGNDYVAMVCKWLDSDFINLGFSGACKAEPNMVEYLSNFDPSIFVLDYDCNAPSVEYYRETHYPLYKTIRDKHPNTPIVFITRPNVENNFYIIEGKRREVVEKYLPVAGREAFERLSVTRATYERAKNSGDENVYLISGEDLLGKADREMNFSDFAHPNDLGFYKMAKTIYPKLKEILEKLNNK